MTLTTQTGITATETIHQDIRPGANVTLPNGQVLSEDAQILMDKSIVARALGTPTAEQIKIKNSSFRYRWVNKEGHGGQLYFRAKAKGFTLATPEDAEPLSCEITNDNGEIRMFDVVLMKIPVEKYQQSMKYQMQQALFLQRDKRYLDNGKSDRVKVKDKSGNETEVEIPQLPNTDVMADERLSVRSANINSGVDGKYVKPMEVSQEFLDKKMGEDKPGRK